MWNNEKLQPALQWLEWLEGEEWRRRSQTGDAIKGGLLLRHSRIISMPDYLRGLWASIQQRAKVSGQVRKRETRLCNTMIIIMMTE
jgi:glycine/D-amino acid oxidase-like deaminating enzyme